MKKVVSIVVSLLILASITVVGFAASYEDPMCIQPIELEEPIPGN